MIRVFKLQFFGVFAQAEDNTHLNARVLPHPLRGSPLPEGASSLAPRKSVARQVILPRAPRLPPGGSSRPQAGEGERAQKNTRFLSGNKLTDKPKF